MLFLQHKWKRKKDKTVYKRMKERAEKEWQKRLRGWTEKVSGHCQLEDPWVILQLSTKPTHTHRNTSVITDWSRSFIQSLDKSEGWRSKMLCCNKIEWKHLLVQWQYFAQPACIPVNFLHNNDMHDSVSSNNNGKNKTQQHHNITWWIVSSFHKSAVLI